jgi:hypothetical protein
VRLESFCKLSMRYVNASWHRTARASKSARPGTGERSSRVELTTEAEPYRWLNTCFLVGEGEIDEQSENWWLDTYVCPNERVHGPPALGAEPPERFR